MMTKFTVIEARNSDTTQQVHDYRYSYCEPTETYDENQKAS
jgi:hypothetical protein